ncbi:hypothetical protein KTO58_02910 [Chitinophaga pendula]|uniref:hypothetical protein n=1 Tax=Chitinophaga TaxID=79328 RepID=UPI000BB01920|nr:MULTISPECIES: hypothetical protein [Chitinophaga]ASZ14213.1 hypothetical protein CK934_26310 [Chitinophaga sp. MD30]UCJ08148.1 hypothetical protein KTO58_02910 [Chitinophaga pendula]
MATAILYPTPLGHTERKDLIKKLWILFRSEGVHHDIREYAVMIEALLAEYGVYFEKADKFNASELAPYEHDVKNWFYEVINTVAMSDNFRDFYAAAQGALDFSRSHNPFR